MTTQLLFYDNATPVSSQRHGDLCIKGGSDFGFARAVNSVPLTAVEFRRAASEYVLVFAGPEDGLMPVAVLGVESNRNLFVKDDGTWDGSYLPAYVRRYPFVFASSDDGKTLTLCVDESFAGCNREGRGERLFDATGERTQYLATVLSFVQDYQAQFQRTRTFCAHLHELGLLEPMQAAFTLPDGERRNLTGFMAINRVKLKELDDQILASMVRSDQLELIYLHLQSMQNFGAMLRRIGAEPHTPAAAGDTEATVAAEGDGAPRRH